MSIKAKNILRNIGFLLSIPVLIGAFVFAVSKDKGSVVQDIEVNVSNVDLGFVTSKDVEKLLLDEHVVLKHTPIENLNIADLEEKVNSNPWVAQAEVFVSASQNVQVKLTQVTPLLRVQRTDSTANGYYLNAQGSIIPLSRSFAADLPILTTERSLTTVAQRKELVDFAQFIEQDSFWHATISQINLDKNNDIELISLIGDANIRFGSTDNMEDKFFRLFQFYKKGINRINWANVRELDLRFDNQLVCRRYHKENHIEERHAPILYTKAKPTAVAKKSIAAPVLSMANVEVPKRRPVVAKNEWKETKAANQIKSTAAKKSNTNNTKKKDLVKPAQKSVQKKIEKKATPNKTVTAKSTPKPVPKKAKKREIIINTEPVTKNK